MLDLWLWSSVKEWNHHSRFECEHHPHPPQCMFGDIADFFTPAVKAILPNLHTGNLFETKLMPLVMNGHGIQMTLNL